MQNGKITIAIIFCWKINYADWEACQIFMWLTNESNETFAVALSFTLNFAFFILRGDC